MLIRLLLGVSVGIPLLFGSVIHAENEDPFLHPQDTEISYVIEPFESIGQEWYLSDPQFASISSASNPLFGQGALQVKMSETGTSTFEVGWVSADRAHNCQGSTRFSFWVKTASVAAIRVSIYDDRACLVSNQISEISLPCNERERLTVRVILNEEIEGARDWQELSIDIDQLDQLDPRHIRGWHIQLGNATGPVHFDQFACIGGGSLLGAAFHIGTRSFEEAVSDGTWMESFYQSAIASNMSTTSISSGRLQMDYVVEQVETWGGFNDIAHLAPGNAYYNLSQATGLVLDFDVVKAASIPGRSIFRFVLQDSSHCENNCDLDYHQQERWYSFNSIMDIEGDGRLTLPLEGSTEATSSFWFTGWSGITGNQVFDLTEIKGFTLEVVLDSGLDIGTTLSGALTFSNMSAVILPETGQDSCIGVVEHDLYFFEYAGQFTRVEFLAAMCCDVCADDPECLYALSNGRDCFMASYVDPNYVGLLTSEITSTFKSYWMDDEIKRGDWCDRCECKESERMIDCKGADLAILPKTFNAGSWEPILIDLQQNPRLVIVGSGSLNEVGNSLLEIRFPIQMKYVAPRGLNGLPRLRSINFESEIEFNQHYIINTITKESGIFGDVCCGLGEVIEVDVETRLINCDLKIDAIGIDSSYDPFLNYLDATILQAIAPSSSFMGEAAESAEKCAEYCSIDDECQFFTYDARLPNAEHICMLFENNGTIYEYVCCDPDHYADEGGTIPGTISGRPPQTRHRIDNARVVYSTTTLVLNQENDFSTDFTISLGSDPLRGAVWIDPVVVSSTLGIEVEVWPSRVSLYNSNNIETIYVSITQAPQESESSTVLLQMNIVSCDEAFTFQDASDNDLVYISVASQSESDKANLGLAIGLPLALTCVLLVVVFVWYEHNRKQNDVVWIVKKGELKFSDPPEVIGRGTFGLVLLGEYRGTQVAVKRVIPPKAKHSIANMGVKSGFGKDWLAAAMSLGSPKEMSQKTTSEDESGGMDSTSSGSAGSKKVAGLQSGSKANPAVGTSSGYNLGKTSCGNPSLGVGSQSSKIPGALSGLLFSSRQAGLKKLGSVEISDRASWRKLRNEFVEEMRYLSKLRHPCVTTVMGAVIGDREEPMLVMEYMDHGSLHDLLKNDTMVIEGEVILPILRDISQGVRFLHSSDPQVIHGDLKAANILVDSKFRAKVSDFGLSQKKHLGGTGTPFWMAPELLRFESPNTAATDVYSFGVILVEVYSRKDPYEGNDTSEVLRLIADKSVQQRPEMPKNCSSQIQSMISECLVDNPDKRPTFQEIDTRLKRIDTDAIEGAGSCAAVSLFDIFPRHIAEALRDGRKVEAEHRDCVTIFFSDIVDFTSISSDLAPRKVAELLDRLYSKFDMLSQSHDIFKVETIGDAYMAVTNLVKDQPTDHAKRIVDFSIDAILAANGILIDVDDPSKGYVNIRVGFHSGPVVADVVGKRSPRYCLFGDTVNSANRMESNSKCNRIHCSSASAELLKEQYPKLPLKSRGLISIKGKGHMHTYWVNEEAVAKRSVFVDGTLSGIEQAIANVDHQPKDSEEFSIDDSVVMEQALANVANHQPEDNVELCKDDSLGLKNTKDDEDVETSCD